MQTRENERRKRKHQMKMRVKDVKDFHLRRNKKKQVVSKLSYLVSGGEPDGCKSFEHMGEQELTKGKIQNIVHTSLDKLN